MKWQAYAPSLVVFMWALLVAMDFPHALPHWVLASLILGAVFIQVRELSRRYKGWTKDE